MLTKLKKSKTSNEKGFTIIEVMIVLAIAGLILLIVFLAVPALQRNGRNTQRKTDIGRIGSAATTVVANANGALAGLDTNALRTEAGTNLAYYPSTGLSVGGAAIASATNGTTGDTVVVYTNAICTSMTGGRGATSTNATAKSIAVVYSTEGGSGLVKGCTDQ